MTRSEILMNEARSLYEEFCQKHPKTNQASFAKKSGVNETTIRRLLSGQSLPSKSNLLKTFLCLYGVKSATDLYKNCSSAQKQFLENFFPRIALQEFARPVDIVAENLIANLKRDEAYVFASLLDSSTGIKNEDLAAYYGHRGKGILTNLVTLNLVSENSEGFFQPTLNELTFTSTANSALFYTKVMEEAYFLEAHSRANLGYTQRVSEEGYECLKQIQIELTSKLEAVFKNHPGTIPVCNFHGLAKLMHGGIKNV